MKNVQQHDKHVNNSTLLAHYVCYILIPMDSSSYISNFHSNTGHIFSFTLFKTMKKLVNFKFVLNPVHNNRLIPRHTSVKREIHPFNEKKRKQTEEER